MSFLIDPCNITDFNCDKNKLENQILFWVCAAGKNANTASKCLNNLLLEIQKRIGHKSKSPFYLISMYDGDLSSLMKECGIGCYNQKANTFKDLANKKIDLKTCSCDDLEKIKGIGRKTSRCFLLHTRKNSKCAGLDVHILRFLKNKGYKVPETTPSSLKEYKRVENIFLDLFESSGFDNIAEYDLHLWKIGSGNL